MLLIPRAGWTPAVVLACVLSACVAIAPEARADATGGTVVGTVVRAYVEHEGESDAGARTDFGAPVTWVRPASGAAVRVPTTALTAVPTGATVSVTLGGPVGDSPATTDHLDPAVQVLHAAVLAPAAAAGTPAPAPTTAPAAAGVTDSVSIAMVAPAGTSADATTVSDLVGVVSGPVADFWRTQSGGAVRIGVADAHDWSTTTDDCSDPEKLWGDVAASIGFQPGAGRHLMLYVPSSDTQCSYGLGEVGSSIHAGGYLYVRDTAVSVVAHELGHNFGLLHSGRQECRAAVEGGTCTAVEYGDYYDVMGGSWSEVGSLDAAQSARLGFLPRSSVVSLGAGASGSYALAPLAGASGIRALRLAAADGTTYYLEYRAATGRDGFLGDPARNWMGLPAGVLVERVPTDDAADSSLLLDATPTVTADYADDGDDVLVPGATVRVGGGSVAVTVTALSPTSATVTVGSAGVAPDPTGDWGPGSSIGGSGSSYYLSTTLGPVADQTFRYGATTDTVYYGDWDGDGVDTPLVRRGNTFFVRNSDSSGVADAVFSYGDPGDTVYVGDWDGDGVDTLAVRRGNRFYLRNSLTSGVADAVFTYGDPGDVVLVGDWDGDGVDSLAIRRGNQYFLRDELSSGPATRTLTYGDPQDVVLVGHWSRGQSGDSLTVRRGNAYFFRYSLSSGTADRVVSYGDVRDTAFAGDWNGNGNDTLGIRRTP